jgi:hypothetical protein
MAGSGPASGRGIGVGVCAAGCGVGVCAVGCGVGVDTPGFGVSLGWRAVAVCVAVRAATTCVAVDVADAAGVTMATVIVGVEVTLAHLAPTHPSTNQSNRRQAINSLRFISLSSLVGGIRVANTR